MARTYDDYIKDEEMLSQLKVGDRVKYISKNKISTVAKFTNYQGSYSYGYMHYRKDCPYIAVTIHLDNGKHINVSPRNLEVLI